MQKALNVSTKKLIICAMLSALAYVITFLEIPIFPPVLKLDLSFAIMLIGGYILGAFYAEIIIVIAVALSLLKSTSAGIGELANFILANVFVMIPVIIYKYKKGLKNVIITLIFVSAVEIGVALICNRFLLFPFYFGKTAVNEFSSWWYLIIIFNLIKTVVNSIITVILYKKLKNLINKFIK